MYGHVYVDYSAMRNVQFQSIGLGDTLNKLKELKSHCIFIILLPELVSSIVNDLYKCRP